jgi:hypothetical protein
MMPNQIQPPMRPIIFAKSLIRCLPLLSRRLTQPRRKANVLMLHFGRCGSTAVGNLLRQHPKITWDSEILQHRKQNLLPECAITKNPKRLIRLRSLRASRSVFGFELKPLPFMHLSSAQLNMSLPHFFSYLRELKITHLIFLARKHYLRQLISSTIAIEQNKYEISPGKKLSSDQININCDSTQMGGKPIRELFHCYDFISEQIREFGHSQNRMRFIELEYQRDILGSPIKAFHKICDSLQLASPQVVLKNAKVNTASIADTVRNLHEVRDALKNTQYEWMTTQDEQIPSEIDNLSQNKNNCIAA